MSAVPAVIPIDPVPPATVGRAYDELADGLARLIAALQSGDLALLRDQGRAGLAAGGPAEPACDPPTHGVAFSAGALRPPTSRLAPERLLTAVAVEAVKTGAVVLVVYQGLLTLLPAPDRPTIAPAAAQASPSLGVELHSVNPAAHGAVGGQHTEVEVDGTGRAGLTAVP